MNKRNKNDDMEITTMPTKIIHCVNSDGSINIMKYWLFKRYKRIQQQQQQFLSNEIDELLESAISAHIDEINEDLIDRRRENRQPTTRSTYRKGINKIRDSDGNIQIINARSSSWYVTYVLHPQHDCNKFNKKFRRRFRCDYSSYLLILDLVKQNDLFSRWHNKFDAVGRECSPIELLLLGTLRYLCRGWCFDDLEENTSISEEIHRVFFHIFIKWGHKQLYTNYVKMPQSTDEMQGHTHEMVLAGLNGCIVL
jgi:hypothetical protein